MTGAKVSDSKVLDFAMPDESWNVAERALPKAGTLVKYRTAIYQMLGYVDVAGKWVATDGREERLPVKAWREISESVANWPERVA